MQSLSIYSSRRIYPSILFLFALLLIGAALISAPSPTSATRPPASQESQKRHRPEFVPGEALVRFKQNRAMEGVRQLALPDPGATGKGLAASAAAGSEVLVNIERFPGSDIVDGLRLARAASGDTMKAIAALQARDDVLYAEPNYLLRTEVTPNDPQFSQLYAMPLIGAPQAWDITTGNRNVVVAIIDEGMDINHEDLLANVWTNPSPGSIAGISGDLHGYDFRDNTGNIVAEPHATHVAGTIGAVGNNNTGVVGVNWQVSLMSLRFISDAAGQGTEADAIEAYNYAKQMRDLWTSSGQTKGANIRAINASYGGGGFSQASADAINALGQAGILFVAAAGNENTDSDVSPHYPSGYSLPNVIAVASTTSADTLSGFSNFGLHTVLMGAPGSGILSTLPGNSYGTFSGTSMATPHVAGAAALLCAANPNLSVNQLRSLLAFNGDLIPALQGKSLSGRRLNVFKSLQAINENDSTPPGTVGSLQVTSQKGRSLNLSWIASGDDGAAGQASLYDLSFVDQTSGKVIPLTTVAPAISGATQSLNVNLPYQHTAGTLRVREFDNVGNEGTPASVPISVHPNFADPYVTSLNPPASLSTGGTALGLTFDDRYREDFPLPFSFSFFGQIYRQVTISTNGNLYFSTPPKRANGDADDVPSSIADLSLRKMISGMWDDLDLSTSRRADADVYVVEPGAGRIIFRWQGVQFGDGTNGDPINFEIELRADGVIITRYGSGNINLLPVVGISGGEPDAYVIDQLTSELSPRTLTNAQSATFTPRALIQLISPTYIGAEPSGHVDFVLSRSGDLTSSASVSLATGDTAGTQPCATLNGRASSRCDYTTIITTVSFAAGEDSKTVSIPISDDVYVEGSEAFTVSLDNGLGAAIGRAAATGVIQDDDSPGGTNPLAQTGFFVRQQYLDFLNREPDTAGFNFWVNNIDVCGANVGCREVRRIDTSASFFLSIEFKETGYLVERMYKAAYGDAAGTSSTGGGHNINVPIIRLDEFLADTQRIGLGVVVNQGSWQQQLEANKVAFIQEFVQRARFIQAFPANLTPTQFVDQLNTRAGNPLQPGERNQLISDLTSGQKTRAQVVRAVAEDQDLVNNEFNRAFVLMEYFGYLRRNPNDPPEATMDYAGYEFWLNKLNQFNGNYLDAEMVKAFLSSIEYNQRFGP